MTQQELENRVAVLEGIIFKMVKSDRVLYSKHIEMLSGRNMILGTGTGTQIGTNTTQKIGFFGATPLAGNSATLNIPFPVTAADLYTALAALGLVYHT